MKFIWIIIIVLIVLVIGIYLIGTWGTKEVLSEKINDINLNELSDDSYRGEYKVGRWESEVEVTIIDHKITDIKLLNKLNHPNSKLIPQTIDKIIEQQSLQIEIVSKATATSKTFLKSIENALINSN